MDITNQNEVQNKSKCLISNFVDDMINLIYVSLVSFVDTTNKQLIASSFSNLTRQHGFG